MSVAEFIKNNFTGFHIIEEGSGQYGILCSIYIKGFDLQKLHRSIEENFNKKFYIAQQEQYFIIYDNFESLMNYWDAELADIKIYQ